MKYYLQDKRCVVGNSMSWWAINGRGYTCDIRCAEVWTKEELIKRGYWEEDEYNEKYKPWQKDYIDKLVQHHVDIQDVGTRKDGSIETSPHTLRSHRPDLLG